MDREAHARFLEYLERYEYFGGPAIPRLGREDWQALDAELTPIRRKLATDACTAEDLARARALKRILLVD